MDDLPGIILTKSQGSGVYRCSYRRCQSRKQLQTPYKKNAKRHVMKYHGRLLKKGLSETELKEIDNYPSKTKRKSNENPPESSKSSTKSSSHNLPDKKSDQVLPIQLKDDNNSVKSIKRIVGFPLYDFLPHNEKLKHLQKIQARSKGTRRKMYLTKTINIFPDQWIPNTNPFPEQSVILVDANQIGPDLINLNPQSTHKSKVNSNPEKNLIHNSTTLLINTENNNNSNLVSSTESGNSRIRTFSPFFYFESNRKHRKISFNSNGIPDSQSNSSKSKSVSPTRSQQQNQNKEYSIFPLSTCEKSPRPLNWVILIPSISSKFWLIKGLLENLQFPIQLCLVGNENILETLYPASSCWITKSTFRIVHHGNFESNDWVEPLSFEKVNPNDIYECATMICGWADIGCGLGLTKMDVKDLKSEKSLSSHIVFNWNSDAPMIFSGNNLNEKQQLLFQHWNSQWQFQLFSDNQDDQVENVLSNSIVRIMKQLKNNS